MRLIDADALFDKIKERHDMFTDCDCEYIEQVGSADGVSVERDGKTYTFAELEVSDE